MASLRLLATLLAVLVVSVSANAFSVNLAVEDSPPALTSVFVDVPVSDRLTTHVGGRFFENRRWLEGGVALWNKPLYLRLSAVHMSFYGPRDPIFGVGASVGYQHGLTDRFFVYGEGGIYSFNTPITGGGNPTHAWVSDWRFRAGIGMNL